MQKKWLVTEAQRREWDVQHAMCDATMRGPLDAMSAAGIVDYDERVRHVVENYPAQRLIHVMWLNGERRGHTRGVC